MRLKRLQDYNLTFLPESRLRLRLGYSHNVDVGPSFSTFNGPAARYLLNENYRITMNGCWFGVDFRFLPKTTISYELRPNQRLGYMAYRKPFRSSVYRLF